MQALKDTHEECFIYAEMKKWRGKCKFSKFIFASSASPWNIECSSDLGEFPKRLDEVKVNEFTS